MAKRGTTPSAAQAPEPPVNGAAERISTEAYGDLRSRLEVELIDKLIARVTTIMIVAAAVGSLITYFGLRNIVHEFVDTEVTKQVAAKQQLIDDYGALAAQALKDATVAGAEANATQKRVAELSGEAAGILKAAVKTGGDADIALKTALQSSKEAGEALATAQAALNAATQEARKAEMRWTQQFAVLFDRDGILKTEITRSGYSGTPPPPMDPALSDADRKAIVVRQDRRETGEQTPDGRKLIELSYSVGVNPAYKAKPASQILAQIDKVEYGFDERWFDPATHTVTTPANGFRYSTRVWGITRVKAVIYLKNPPDLLLFAGSMNLTSPTQLAATGN